jgi:hypothetical protein
MMDYHNALTRETQWVRTPVKNLRVMPLEDTPPLFIDRSLFEFDVSEEAIADTAARIGLQIRVKERFHAAVAVKVDADHVFIRGSAEFFHQPRLAHLARAPDDQGFSVCAVLPLHQFFHRFSVHEHPSCT